MNNLYSGSWFHCDRQAFVEKSQCWSFRAIRVLPVAFFEKAEVENGEKLQAFFVREFSRSAPTLFDFILF